MTIYKLTVTSTQGIRMAIGSSAKKTKGEALSLIYKDPEKIADFLNDIEIEIAWQNKAWTFLDTEGNVKAVAVWELDADANYKRNMKMYEERLSARKAYERHMA